MENYINQGDKDTRSGFGEGLTELGRSNKNVVALCADLTGSLKMNEFAKENPERFFQAGIAEANMIGLAAGLATGGKIPFTGTFANFSTGRVYDQIKSAQRATTLELVLPNSAKPAPKPLLVSFFCVYVYFFIFYFAVFINSLLMFLGFVLMHFQVAHHLELLAG